MNVRQIFESPYVQAAFIVSTLSVVACFMGPKIIADMDFQKAQDLWKSGNSFCQKTNEPIMIVKDIPNSVMDQLSVAGSTVKTPWIESLHILNSGSDTNDNGVVGFTCKPKMRDLPGTELSQISPLYPSTALTQILQHHNSRG